MIVQTAPRGEAHLVIPQLEHTRLAGRFAAVWGNDLFAPLAPKELMEYVVVHHDEGWDIVDAEVGRAADTGLPWNLVGTPIPQLLRSGTRGPELAERFHPFAGLLVSMHTYGLYHGRYGLSDKVFVNMVPDAFRPAVLDMLQREMGRQERLRARLAADPATAPWVEEKALFHNYKLLQFFDTLSLYFNCTHEAARGTSTFANVPRAIGDDVTITVSRLGAGEYRVTPFPFAKAGVEIGCAFHRMTPQPDGTDMAKALAAAPQGLEMVRLLP